MGRKRTETVLTLVRHGESSYNLKGLYQGDSDAPELTLAGRRQAGEVSHLIAPHYDAFWCSPLCRARQTADIMRQKRPDLPSAQIVPQLAEIALPLWQGRSIAEVRASDPEAHHCWKFTPSRFLMATDQCGDASQRAINDNGFSPAGDVLGRADLILSKARDLPAGRTILAVTHGGMIRALVSRALSMSADHLHTAVLDNCSMTQIAFGPNGEARVLAFNRRAMSPQDRLAEKIAQGAPIFAVGPLGSANALRRVTGQKLCRMSAADPIAELNNPAGPVIAEVDADAQRDLFCQVLGLAGLKPMAMPLEGEGLHVFIKPTPSNRAALWLLNEALTDTAGLSHSTENEVELA